MTTTINKDENKFQEDRTYKNLDLSGSKLVPSEFSNCKFIDCNLDKADFTGKEFTDCVFNDCNLSMLQLKDASVKNVNFINCKMIGIDFSVVKDFLFAINAKDCNLDFASFFRRKMKKTNFTNCSLKEVDFEETDLSGSIFNDCNLMKASFINTNLEKVDFRKAANYFLDPEMNRIKQAKFSYPEVLVLLSKYDIKME